MSSNFVVLAIVTGAVALGIRLSIEYAMSKRKAVKRLSIAALYMAFLCVLFLLAAKTYFIVADTDDSMLYLVEYVGSHEPAEGDKVAVLKEYSEDGTCLAHLLTVEVAGDGGYFLRDSDPSSAYDSECLGLFQKEQILGVVVRKCALPN